MTIFILAAIAGSASDLNDFCRNEKPRAMADTIRATSF
jgi:hypothetical protein